MPGARHTIIVIFAYPCALCASVPYFPFMELAEEEVEANPKSHGGDQWRRKLRNWDGPEAKSSIGQHEED